MRIEFDIATPSLNKLHSNRWQMLNWKKKFLSRLKGYELIGLTKPLKAIVLIRRFGSRLYDVDNLVGGCKPLIDALKEKHIIWDDRLEYLSLEVQQFKTSRRETKTIVWFEYAQEAL